MNRSRPSTYSLLIAAAGLMASALFTVTAAQADPQGPHVLQVRLSPTGATPRAAGKVKFRFVRQYSRFTVEAHGLLPGSYDVLIGGGAVGTMDVGPEESIEAACRFTLDSRLASGMLFDPRGTSVEIVNHVSGVTELATDEFPSDKSAERRKVEIAAAFVNTGIQAAAAGTAEFKSFKGRSRLALRVEGLAPGTYDVLVGDTVRALVAVGSLDAVNVSFDSLPTAGVDDPADESVQQDQDHERGYDGGSRLLTFDPRGLVVALVLAGEKVLLLDPFPEN